MVKQPSDRLPVEEFGTGSGTRAGNLTTEKLMLAHFQPPEINYGPGAAPGETIYTAPVGYYAVCEVAGFCNIAAQTEGNIRLSRYNRGEDPAAGVHVIQGWNYYNTDAVNPVAFNFHADMKIVLDEGDSLYIDDVLAANNPQTRIYVVLVPKVWEHVP